MLEVGAGLAAHMQDWDRAARLYGAAEEQARETGLHRDPADEAFLAPLMARARNAAGAEAFAAAEAAGRALSYATAIDEARLWLTRRG